MLSHLHGPPIELVATLTAAAKGTQLDPPNHSRSAGQASGLPEELEEHEDLAPA